ncbi:MAG: right-handed parallel beta-helix repeat-containing protein, partial [Alphaproteobacteria bacterium]
NNLTIRGVGGQVRLLAAGRSAARKAIWVIRGNNTRVENITFSGARVRDRNGAGIRLEGAGLILENCEFRDNQMGILTGANPASDVVIRNSRFVGNVVEGSRSLGHNVYVGNINSLTMINSHVEGAVRGHNVKSRARLTTLIGNRIIDGETGASSYLVDLAAGGIAILRDNYLEQGTRAENYTLVSYGAERLLHSENRLLVVNNRFVNRHSRGTFIYNHTDSPAEVTGNIFEGSGTVLRGPGIVTPPSP